MLGSYIIASRVGSQSGALAAMVGPLGWCAATWRCDRGTSVATTLTGVYLGAFALSHPPARRVGVWSSVLGATAATGAATYAVADRTRSYARAAC
jgi:ammonia channel protein AmtB